MQVLVLSDTHLSRATSQLAEICEQYCTHVDRVLHLGDWTGIEVLEYLEQFPLHAVAGNMDDDAIRSRLPSVRSFQLGGRRIGMAHGCGYEGDLHGNLRKQFPEAAIICYGHTHRPVSCLENGVLFFNPGSVFAGRGPCAGSIGLLHLNDTIRAQHIAL